MNERTNSIFQVVFIKKIMLLKNILFFLSGWMMFSSSILYAGTPVPADKIKAAYTFQFSKFATWPDKNSHNKKYFSVCILGQEPIAKELESLRKYKTNGRSISVFYLKKITNIDKCNILYIAETERNRLNVIFHILKNKPVLTVSSIPDFALQGGIVGLVTDNNKIRLEINMASARKADIKLSAKLLEIANVIKSLKYKEEQP